MGAFLGLSFALLLSSSAFAATQKCSDLIQDMKAMQGAQKQLLESMSHKNSMMATVLDQQADKLDKQMSQQRTLKKSDLYGMHVSARAFRNHEKREAALIARFQKASDELLGQVQSCLESSKTFEKLGQR